MVSAVQTVHFRERIIVKCSQRDTGWALNVQPSQPSINLRTGNLTLPSPSSALQGMKYKLQGAQYGCTGEERAT